VTRTSRPHWRPIRQVDDLPGARRDHHDARIRFPIIWFVETPAGTPRKMRLLDSEVEWRDLRDGKALDATDLVGGWWAPGGWT